MTESYVVSLKTLDGGSVQYLDGKKTEFSTQSNFTFSEIDQTLHVNRVEAESFISKSDERFKENISNLNWRIEDIHKLTAKKYNYKGNSETKHVGYIAQDVMDILPDLVAKDSQDRLYVNYQEMIPILAECIKALHSKNNELEEKINRITFVLYLNKKKIILDN
jgi:hypothetical protein